MCANFGLDVEVDIPDGRAQGSDERHVLKTYLKHPRFTVASCKCRYCGTEWGLHSNHAVRVIARYFLSLSLPFADCPDVACENHGKNVFEHWTNRRGASRPYRREGAHKVRCRGCERVITLGTARGVHVTARKESGRQRPKPLPAWVTRGRWEDIVSGLYSGRSITDTYEQFNISPGNYYRTLRRIGARLRDYHCVRNARLLHPEGPAHDDGTARVYTDVLQVSLQAFRRERRHTILDVIVSVMVAERKIFILAAHPCFLPIALGPAEDALESELIRPEFEREWCSVLHAQTPIDSDLTPNKQDEKKPDLDRPGQFISAPYAQLAHFLVVQKMLSRFRDIHCYMDGARDLSKAALVAFRDRIIAGGAAVTESDGAHAQPRKGAEVVLYQHKRSTTVGRKPLTVRRGSPLAPAWRGAEKRFAKQENPPGEIPLSGGEPDPQVRAGLYRKAFHGAFSDDGHWAWLRYPRDTAAYSNCRTLWATRMPTKTFESHGEAALSEAMLQPVDSIMNSMRARVRPIARPLLSASGRSYRSNYIAPGVMHDELSVYLVRQNYAIRRKTSRRIIPAAAMGLLDDDEPPLNVTDCAWSFRLGVEHAELISRWLRQ